jgi:5'-3' exonuclease
LKPLIDADIILYEIGFSCQGVDEEKNEIILHWDSVKEKVDKLIAQICFAVGATEAPSLFLTGKDNFRIEVAQKKGYKAGRDKPKPHHYENIKQYLIWEYGAQVIEGIEADDAICIYQTEALARGEATIICTRDKDLRQCQGWHYGWECGKQAEFGPVLVEGFGELKASYYPDDHKAAGKMKDLKGTGNKWFLAQLLMGDAVDNIPGLPKYGMNKVLYILDSITSYEEGIEAVIAHYQKSYEDGWKKELLEQAQLVWMIRERDENDKPVMWRLEDDGE